MKHGTITSIFLIAAGTAAFAQPAVAQSQVVETDYALPAQPLAATLRAISAASGANILAPGDLVDHRQAPSLQGHFTVDRALALVLEGSGLRARATPSAYLIEQQAAPAATTADITKASDTITVTGSRIRGAPVASPVISVSQDAIRNSGQSTLGEVVRSIPQSFGGGQQPGIGFNVPNANAIDVGGASSINLRGLGGDATLTLLNGHRLSYGGSRQSVDVSVIPVSVVDRLEIVPDGASAIYGSDAVAGVANIILKRDYDGLETRAQLGASTDGGYFTQQYGALAGHKWSSGGFALAYEFNRNSPIQSSQRSYARDATPGLTLFPAIKSHNVLLTGHRDLGAAVSIAIDALYNQRQEFTVYPLDFGGDLAAFHGERSGGSKSFVLAPSLDWRVGGDWHATLSATLAQDHARFLTREYQNTTQIFTSGGCYCNDARSIEAGGAGSLATLPAGSIKVAIGAGYRRNRTDFSAGSGNTQNFIRSQASYFSYAELNLPIVSPAMQVGGIVRLNLSGAVRYERYPGIGDVATPKFGILYAPSSSVDFKASWGKSFRAATLRQQFQPRVVVLLRPTSVGGSGYPAGSAVAVVDGGDPALKPERATSWSATLGYHPPMLESLRFELSYFHTLYHDRIVAPIDRSSQTLSNPVYRPYVTLAPSPAEVAALVASAATFRNSSGSPYDPTKVVAIANDTNVNAGQQRIHGIDALASYNIGLDGPDRSIELNANVSYLKSDQQITAALPVTTLAGNVFNPPHWRGRGGASWQDGALTLTADVTYIGSVVDNRALPVRRIAAMYPVGLTARYRTRGTGLTGGVDVALSLQNAFNDKPATISGIFFEAPYDSTNASPVGRYVSLSIAKKW